MSIQRSPRILAALALASCSEQGLSFDLPPLSQSSQRANIGLADWYEHDPLCRGDLDRIDRQVARAEKHLGMVRSEPVEIYLLDAPKQCLRDDQAACYIGDPWDIILAGWDNVEHEIVHAVARGHRFPSLFWSEGAATMLSGATYRDTLVRLQPSDLEAEKLVNYRSAGHFSRFFAETYGWDAYRKVIRTDTLHAVTGESPQTVMDRYHDEAPYSYPSLEPCPFAPIPRVSDRVWQDTVVFDCNASDTSSFEFLTTSNTAAPAVLRSLELPAGRYMFEFDGELAASFVLVACQTEAIEAPPEPDMAPMGDLRNEVEGFHGTWFPGIGQHIIDVAAARYRVALVGGGYGSSTTAGATFTVTRVDG